MRLARFAFAATLLVVVPACGGGGGEVSEAAASRLQPQVQALREAAATGSREAANHELADLRGLVEELSATDELSEGGARRVLAAAERVEANLALLATTTTAPSTTTTTTTTAPPPPPPDEGDEKEEEKQEKEQEKQEEQLEEQLEEVLDPDDTNPGKGNGGNRKD